MNRRGFFGRLAKAALVAVAAPMIVREVLAAELPAVTAYRSNSIGVYEQLRMCSASVQTPTKLDLESMFQTLYAIKRRRDC